MADCNICEDATLEEHQHDWMMFYIFGDIAILNSMMLEKESGLGGMCAAHHSRMLRFLADSPHVDGLHQGFFREEVTKLDYWVEMWEARWRGESNPPPRPTIAKVRRQLGFRLPHGP